MESSIMKIIKKTKLPGNPDRPLLVIEPKESKFTYYKVTAYCVYCDSTCHNNQVRSQSRYPLTDEQVNQLWSIKKMKSLESK